MAQSLKLSRESLPIHSSSHVKYWADLNLIAGTREIAIPADADFISRIVIDSSFEPIQFIVCVNGINAANHMNNEWNVEYDHAISTTNRIIIKLANTLEYPAIFRVEYLIKH